MNGARQWIFLMLAALAPCESASAQAPRSAFTSEAATDADTKRRIGEQQRQLTNQPCRVCFIGDSLTEFWTSTGDTTWNTGIAPLKALNLGIAAERTEHILHRIDWLDFRRANPKVIVLLMGTNNLAMEPPDAPKDVVKAIMTGVIKLRAKLPPASIVVLDLPPNGYEADTLLRQRIRETNTLLANAGWPSGVQLLSIHDAMAAQDGRWREGLTIDGTHFSKAGYQKLSEFVVPVVKKLLDEKG